MAKQTNRDAIQIPLVEETFRKVNLKIEQLLDCSIKDFILLNNTFKQYHNTLNTHSQSSNTFFEIFCSNDIAIDFQKVCESIEFMVKKVDSTLQTHIFKLKELGNSYNYILLCSNNLKQDLSTIHLLFTNLRFDPRVNFSKGKFEKSLNLINEYLSEIDNQVKSQYKQISQVIEFADDAYKNGLDLHAGIIDKISTHISYLTDLKENSIKYKEELKDVEGKKNDSTSEIITNLQFQDILRQKIEHIQEAHQEITTKLYSSGSTNTSLGEAELFQIRDITALQSALLIHANQEYQKAVETIVQRISALKVFLNSYKTIWNHFCQPEINKVNNKLADVINDIGTLKTKTYSFSLFAEKHIELIKGILHAHGTTLSQMRKNGCFHSEAQKLEEHINSITKPESDSNITTLKQLQNEIVKFQKSRNKLLQHIEEFDNKKLEEQIKLSSNDLAINDLTGQLDDIFSHTKNLISSIQKITPNEVSDEPLIDFSVDQVSYYKTFETEVKEIILLLDGLLDKMNINKSDIDPDKLDHIKDVYTMQSERDVHESLVHKDKEKDKENNNDDIEFF